MDLRARVEYTLEDRGVGCDERGSDVVGWAVNGEVALRTLMGLLEA